MLTQRFDATASEGQFSINLNDLPSGTYIGTITVDGQRRLVSKLAIVK
jgi:hypothetical protein